MNKILILLMSVALLVPCISSAGEDMQQTELDKLIENYQLKQRPEPKDKESEIRRLKSQLIDLRVERDQLVEQVLYLQDTLDSMMIDDEHLELHSECLNVECIPVTDVENDKILTHIIYTLSQYRLAELIVELVPNANVEAHNKAQRIMAGAKRDLNFLGFDTSDMDDYPTLDELLEQWTISNGSRTRR